MNLHNRACKALTVQHEKLCYWCWLTNDYIAYLSMNFWSWGERMLYSCCFYCDDVRNHVWISCCHGDDHGHCDVSVFVWRWLLIAYGVDYPQVLLKKKIPDFVWQCHVKEFLFDNASQKVSLWQFFAKITAKCFTKTLWMSKVVQNHNNRRLKHIYQQQVIWHL